MEMKERNYMLSFIKNAFQLVMFQHEQVRLETMMAKYCDPKTVITKQEVSEDLKWLENIFA
jgi:hypothetical protein